MNAASEWRLALAKRVAAPYIRNPKAAAVIVGAAEEVRGWRVRAAAGLVALRHQAKGASGARVDRQLTHQPLS